MAQPQIAWIRWAISMRWFSTTFTPLQLQGANEQGGIQISLQRPAYVAGRPG